MKKFSTNMKIKTEKELIKKRYTKKNIDFRSMPYLIFLIR